MCVCVNVGEYMCVYTCARCRSADWKVDLFVNWRACHIRIIPKRNGKSRNGEPSTHGILSSRAATVKLSVTCVQILGIFLNNFFVSLTLLKSLYCTHFYPSVKFRFTTVILIQIQYIHFTLITSVDSSFLISCKSV